MQMQFNRVGVRELCELLLEGRGETCEFANHEIVRIATTGQLSSFVGSLVKYDESLREREHEVSEEKKLTNSKMWKDKCERRPLTVGSK